MNRISLVLLVCIAAGCATGRDVKNKPARVQAPNEASRIVDVDPRPEVTLELAEPTSLGGFLPTLADTVGGSLVIMNGLEDIPVGVQTWKRAPFKRVVQDIAAPANLKIEEKPAYFFLYAAGYEPLETVSIEGRLDPAFDAITASIGFGYGTALFESFAYMASSLGVTLVCDQLLGDAETGALNLAESPLHVCLAALLKSARIPMEAFDVEATPEYLFIRAKPNGPRNTLINPLELNDAQTDILNKKVNVDVPSSPLNVSRVQKLRDALPALSQQLGIQVTAEPGLEDLPVSPAVFRNARVRTVLDLIIRQWPLPEFAYRVDQDCIVIQRLR